MVPPPGKQNEISMKVGGVTHCFVETNTRAAYCAFAIYEEKRQVKRHSKRQSVSLFIIHINFTDGKQLTTSQIIHSTPNPPFQTINYYNFTRLQSVPDFPTKDWSR